MKIDAIKHDRLGVGVPTMSAPEGVTENTAEWKNAQATIDKIHANENGGIIKGFGWGFEIVQGEGKGTDVVPSINMHNQEMGVSVLSQFLDLGVSSSGNRALGTAFIDLFLKAIQSHVDSILSVINKFAIQEWVRFNFGDIGFFPKIKANKIKSLDTTEIAALSTAGLITHDFEIENAIRRNEKLPEIKEEDRDTKIAAKKKDEIKPDDTTIPEGKENDTALSAKKHYSFVVSARELKPLIIDFDKLADEEKLVNLQAIDNTLSRNQIATEDTLLEMREKQIDNLINQLIGGRKVQNLSVILKADMAKFLKSEYRNMRKIGRGQVIEEREQQQKGFAMQELPPIEDLAEITAARLDLEVEGSANKLKTMLSEIMITGIDQGLSGEELEVFMREEGEGISTATWITMAATAINKGWGDGRRTQSVKFEDEISHGFYSSILDSARCPECERTQNLQTGEGGRHVLEDPRFVTPNPNCLGSTRCRCFTIYVFEDVA